MNKLPSDLEKGIEVLKVLLLLFGLILIFPILFIHYLLFESWRRRDPKEEWKSSD